MNARHLTVLAAAAALAIPVAALAAKPPPKGQLTLTANTPTVVYNPFLTPPGGRATLSGQLKGPNNTGVTVRLEENPFPFTDNKFTPTSHVAMTDTAGKFTFSGVEAPVNTQFRATTQQGPSKATSNVALVQVRLRVTRHASRSTVRPCRRVRFSGRAYPAHDGKPVAIQRRVAPHRWRTKKRTVLLNVPGQAFSRYSARVRVCTTGTYRVRVSPNDGDHIRGFSRSKRIRVT